jgi:sugar-specific transcriptional regulator TrmB
MMADDSEFLSKLISFGLSEKEAQLYFHLLKYGSKSPSLIAKSLKTYREDVHRTLTGLIDKGMVNPSLEAPTVYTAVELDIALEAAIKTHETELREMERRKQELQDLSKQQSFRPSDEFSTFKILKNAKETMAMCITLVNSSQEEYLVCVNELTAIFADLFGINEAGKAFVDRGGKVRAIYPITKRSIELTQHLLKIHYDIRHFDQYSGIMFNVFDRKNCMFAINADLKRLSLDESMSALLTDDATYAKYLISTFDLLWEPAIPAEQRIEELLKEDPPEAL